MVSYNSPRPSQAPRDPHLERRLVWLRAETARLNGRWNVRLGLELAIANYGTFLVIGHDDWRHEAWRLIQIASELLAQIEKL